VTRTPPVARVAMFTLGGTIAMTAPGGGATGVRPALTGEQLLAAVPGLDEAGAEIEIRPLRQLPGAALTLADIVELAGAIAGAERDGADGAVVIQGTDTIEETSYALDLLHTGEIPVVVTGAMRNAAMAGADGPANILAAVQVAASPQARGAGSLVAFADEIHAARFVRKVHATSIAAFASPGAGPVGHVVEGSARFHARPVGRIAVTGARAGHIPPVALAAIGIGDGGELLTGVDARFGGAVIAAFGAGHVPPGLVPALEDIAARMPAVLATRTGAGPVLARSYGFPGSESDLLARGLISAGSLDPFKARVLLQLLLSAGLDRGSIAEAVAAAGGLSQPPDQPGAGRRARGSEATTRS
jgi:L-asparaginase